MKFFFVFHEDGIYSIEISFCFEWYKSWMRLIYVCVDFQLNKMKSFDICVFVCARAFVHSSFSWGHRHWFQITVSRNKGGQQQKHLRSAFCCDPFTHHEANAQRSTAQKSWWISFHEWVHRCTSRWLRKTDVRKVEALAKHKKRTEKNKSLIPANETSLFTLICILLISANGEQIYFFISEFSTFFIFILLFCNGNFLFFCLLLFNIRAFLRLWKRFKNEY